MPRVGDYEVDAEIGRGGMGVVYRARAPRGGVVAVKVVTRRDAEGLARFDREVRLLRALGEAEGFVPILDDGTSPMGRFLVMPYLRGGTLRDRLRRGPLPLPEVRRLGAALARALAGAHARGIVHRDLKPENVLFADDGKDPAHRDVPLIADLGLAKHFATRPDSEPGARDMAAPGDGAAPSVVLSKTGELRGTVGYLAPEQIVDARSAADRADVFSLGAILYEAIAGEPAFPGESTLTVIGKISEGRFEPLGDRAPRDVSRLVEACLAVRPEDRPSVLDVARGLEGEKVALCRSRRSRATRRAAGLVALGGALLLGLLAVGERVASGRWWPAAAGEQPATARGCLDLARACSLRHEDEAALGLLANAGELARGLDEAVRPGIERALADVAAEVGGHAFETRAFATEARAYELEARVLSHASDGSEERHLAAQVLSGALGRRELERRAVSRSALSRPPLLLACGKLYDLAVVLSSSKAKGDELEALAKARLPLPPELRGAVATAWLEEMDRRFEEYRHFWGEQLAVAEGPLQRSSALFERVLAAFAKAREADPSLGPFPSRARDVNLEIVSSFNRFDHNLETVWREAFVRLAEFGDHPVVPCLACRAASMAEDAPKTFEEARRVAAALAPHRGAPGQAAFAELAGFSYVVGFAFNFFTKAFKPDTDRAAEVLERLAAASGSADLAATAEALRKRDGDTAYRIPVAWRERFRSTIPGTLPAEEAPGGR